MFFSMLNFKLEPPKHLRHLRKTKCILKCTRSPDCIILFSIDRDTTLFAQQDLIAITSLYVCTDEQKVLPYSYLTGKNVCISFSDRKLKHTCNFIMSPQLKRRGGHIAFGVDPVSVRVASCLHSFSWTNAWILTKLAQTHYWDGAKKWLDFSDPWPHFQGHTSTLKFSNFDQKSLSAPHLLN